MIIKKKRRALKKQNKNCAHKKRREAMENHHQRFDIEYRACNKNKITFSVSKLHENREPAANGGKAERDFLIMMTLLKKDDL